jgi:serine/threonine protein kinase
VVLFEMLTGKRAFEGDDVSDTLAAVLRAEPGWNALPPRRRRIRALLQRCLRKDAQTRMPQSRYRAITRSTRGRWAKPRLLHLHRRS